MDTENPNDDEVNDFGVVDAPGHAEDNSESTGVVDIRLDGGRFDTTGMPVSALIELQRIQDLITTVARALWKRNHPKRQRVPRNFASDLDLRLTRVDEGSVVPVLERVDPAPGLWDDEFGESMTLINRAFVDIVKHLRLPADFPKEAEAVLARFGSTLEKGESAIFLSKTSSPVRYTPAIRKRFFGDVRQTLVSQSGRRVGRISALDVVEQTFRFEGLDGKRIEGVYEDPSHWEDLSEVLKVPSLHCWVRLEGTYRLRPDSSLHSIADVESLEVFDLDEDEPWGQRLLQLADLPENWDEDWEAVSTASLEFAREVLRGIQNRALRLPGVFPTQEGGVQLEWNSQHRRLAISISPEVDVESRLMVAATRERERLEHADLASLETYLEGIELD